MSEQHQQDIGDEIEGMTAAHLLGAIQYCVLRGNKSGLGQIAALCASRAADYEKEGVRAHHLLYCEIANAAEIHGCALSHMFTGRVKAYARDWTQARQHYVAAERMIAELKWKKS